MAVFRVERIKDYTVMSNHHALALQVSGIPLTAVATRMSAPPKHVSAWISRAVHKLRNDESFLSSLHEN